MKKTFKQILAAIMTAVMILTAIPFGGIAFGALFAPKASAASIPGDAAVFNGHSYKVYSSSASSWYDAEALCESMGGHLATISSDDENSFISGLVISGGYRDAYFGFSDDGHEGNWTWVNGENIGYTNWHDGEPNNNSFSGNENFAEFHFDDGTWNDGDFGKTTSSYTDAANFICEWDFVAEKNVQ